RGELLDWEGDRERLPEDDPEHEDDDRRPPVDRAPLERRRHTATSLPARRSRTPVTSSKNRGSSRVRAVRGYGRSTSTIADTRPGRADITTTRVERKTASGI